MDGELSVVGLVGTLTIGTRGLAGAGEVLVKIRGGSETYLAWSDRPLPKGAPVLIIEHRGARTVGVVQWSGGPAATGDTLSD